MKKDVVSLLMCRMLTCTVCFVTESLSSLPLHLSKYISSLPLKRVFLQNVNYLIRASELCSAGPNFQVSGMGNGNQNVEGGA